MAEQEYTEAGKLGRKIRSSLKSAWESAKRGEDYVKRGVNFVDDLGREYLMEPLKNLYPLAVNLAAAGAEVGYGIAGKPASFGRFPYYDIKTRFDESEPAPTEEQIDETPTITVSKKAKPSKLWRVMTEGGDRTKDEFYNSKKEADAALKKSGGKGVVMGLTIPEDNQGALKRQYIQNVRENWGANKPAKQAPIDQPSPETEEEFLYQQISRLNPNATEKQKQTYVERVSASRAKRREREGYADEYQARLAKGTLPTEYEQRRMGEEASARGMRDFITSTRIRDDLANQISKNYDDEMRYLKAAERQAARRKDYEGALQSRQLINSINELYGVSSKDSGARMRRFKDIATDEIRKSIEERDEARREFLKKQTTASPEVS